MGASKRSRDNSDQPVVRVSVLNLPSSLTGSSESTQSCPPRIPPKGDSLWHMGRCETVVLAILVRQSHRTKCASQGLLLLFTRNGGAGTSAINQIFGTKSHYCQCWFDALSGPTVTVNLSPLHAGFFLRVKL